MAYVLAELHHRPPASGANWSGAPDSGPALPRTIAGPDRPRRRIVGYLRDGRPRTAEGRSVFVRAQAQHRALTSTGVTTVVAIAGRRAGLGTVGAHRLRHSAATAMLRAGGSLHEIGDVLRHRRAMTTAIYGKLDR